MAKSRFEYVKSFETEDNLLLNSWIVVRIDGKGFHRFSDNHEFEKPNDIRALDLMNKSADHVMRQFNEITIAYGQSDEYSFVFHRKASAYNRRASKLMTNMCSLFASAYVFHWKDYFKDVELKYPPSFDARCIVYPTDENIRDYLSWRQADCHINNLYNTVFWSLVQEGKLTTKAAQHRLKGTLSGEKNEILFSQFNINYNTVDEVYRKGTVLLRTNENAIGTKMVEGEEKEYKYKKFTIKEMNCDIIGEKFWNLNPQIVGENNSAKRNENEDHIPKKHAVKKAKLQK